MTEVKLRKLLFQRIRDLSDEIEEGLAYGTPHLVGEISRDSNGDVNLDLRIVHFADASHRILLQEDNSVLFMLPINESNARKVFLELWSFLKGRPQGNDLGPGTSIKGVLKTALRRRGFEVIWMSVIGGDSRGYVEVIASKAEKRYRMVFERKSPDEFVLMEMEKM